METYQEKAWECLTKPEQDSLFLNISQGLSTRRTGEVLNMTHYKYLELKARAEKFFKMFSDYYYLHPSLVRPQAPLTEAFRDYLIGCIEKRLSKSEAVNFAGDSSWHLHDISTHRIIHNMNKLKASENEWDKHLYALIIEFDRWNSWRILPQLLQAPSAYKRRVNKKYKIYLRYLQRVPDAKLRYITDKFWSKKKNLLYIGLVSDSVFPKYGYQTVPIENNPKVIAELTGMKIYVFRTQLDAEEFGISVSRYFAVGTPREGLRFWKEFDTLLVKAVNYREITNTDFTVDNLDYAYELKEKRLNPGAIARSGKIKKHIFEEADRIIQEEAQKKAATRATR